MISIHRNIETKDLEIMITSDTNTSYIKYATATNETHLHQLIGSSARAMGLSWDDAVSQFDDMYAKLKKLSKERKRRIENINPMKEMSKNESFDFVYFTLIANGVLTLHEVHWLDWYVKRNKLL